MREQYKQILVMLNSGKPITPMDAIRYFGITKLSTRIGEMERDEIVKVDRVRKLVWNRYGKPAYIMTYKKQTI